MIPVPTKYILAGGTATLLGFGAVLTLVHQNPASIGHHPSTKSADIAPMLTAPGVLENPPAVTVNGVDVPVGKGTVRIPVKGGTATATVSGNSATVNAHTQASSGSSTPESGINVRVESNSSGGSTMNSQTFTYSSSDTTTSSNSSFVQVDSTGAAEVEINH